jgi:hypothetical protein
MATQLQRIKGQETTVIMTVDGVQQSSLSFVRSLTITPRFEIKEEGYLGQYQNAFDEIFNGCNFNLELNYGDDGVVDFMLKVKERAQRRTPGTVINMLTTLRFPGAAPVTVTLSDCFFGDFPLGFGSRSDYGTFTITGSCSDIVKQ